MNIKWKMTSFCLALMSSSMLVAASQELDLLATRLEIKSKTLSPWATMESGYLSAFCIRYGYDLATYGPTSFQLQATYQVQSKVTLKVDSNSRYYFYAPASFKQDGLAVGGQAHWRHGAEFGLGPELRWERLANGTISASQVRPWLTARVGWYLPTSDLTYTVGLEGAWALTASRRPGSWTTDINGYTVYGLTSEGSLLSYAPNSGISLYVGARF